LEQWKKTSRMFRFLANRPAPSEIAVRRCS
jgi:hypothetical protein